MSCLCLYELVSCLCLYGWCDVCVCMAGVMSVSMRAGVMFVSV